MQLWEHHAVWRGLGRGQPVKLLISRQSAGNNGVFLKFLVVLTVCLAILSCQAKKSEYPPLTIAGSTSVEPFAEKLAEVFMKEHPGVLINVQGGGSSAGIYACRQGACQLGASSRELVESEKELIEIPIAWDGIAIIVHPSNPLKNLTLKELRQIFLGALKNWQDLGWGPQAIHVITREEGSGTRETFEHIVMEKKEITPGALVQDSNGSVREIVAADPYALGYISVGLVDDRVKALSIDGVAPTPENIQSKRYQLARRFLLVSRSEPTGLAKKFIDFILSPPGQRLLTLEGLVAVR